MPKIACTARHWWVRGTEFGAVWCAAVTQSSAEESYPQPARLPGTVFFLFKKKQ
jgi:hypothetical protein